MSIHRRINRSRTDPQLVGDTHSAVGSITLTQPPPIVKHPGARWPSVPVPRQPGDAVTHQRPTDHRGRHTNLDGEFGDRPRRPISGRKQIRIMKQGHVASSQSHNPSSTSSVTLSVVVAEASSADRPPTSHRPPRQPLQHDVRTLDAIVWGRQEPLPALRIWAWARPDWVAGPGRDIGGFLCVPVFVRGREVP
ncbi:MAG: hypothetical protein ACI9N0_002044 [Ilumatobacter sp.]|jgi:hypothetical protein